MANLTQPFRTLGRNQYQAWFGNDDPRVLAIARLLVFSYLWPAFDLPNHARWLAFRNSAWQPVGLFKALDIPLLSATSLNVLDVLFYVSSLFALLGFFYRGAAWTAALTWLYLEGLPQQFGKINHDQLLLFAVVVLAMSNAADAWSVDAWLKKRRGLPAALPSGEYRWPVRFLGLLILTMYAAAGGSKLLRTGLDWAASDSFRWLLLRHHFTHSPPTRIGVWLADFPQLCKGLSFFALALECLCPLALLGKWPYRITLLGLASLQLGIFVSMGVGFPHMIALFGSQAPWQAVLGFVDRKWKSLGQAAAAAP